MAGLVTCEREIAGRVSLGDADRRDFGRAIQKSQARCPARDTMRIARHFSAGNQ